MITKTVLVLFLLVGRSSIEIQGTAKYPTEQECWQAAKTLVPPSDGWSQYPVKKATCTYDLSGNTKQ